MRVEEGTGDRGYPYASRVDVTSEKTGMHIASVICTVQKVRRLQSIFDHRCVLVTPS
jgi:hypothetical protein